MTDPTYKLIELTGTSKTSIEEAVQNALTKAHASVRNMRWFVVSETRGAIADGKVATWQITLKVGFHLDD